MTRQEARQIIAIWLVSSKGAKGQRGYIEGWFDEEDVEAFRMAIQVLEQEPEQRHWGGTPQEFAEKMYQLAENGDAEADHIKADELMCQLLTSLGYGEGVKIFREMYKWYS